MAALQQKLAELNKAVWELLLFHTTAQFVLPPRLRGVLEHQQVVLMGKAMVGMMARMLSV